MKKTRFNEAQITAVLRQMEGDVPVAKLCREHGMSSTTLYKRRAKYGRMDSTLISEMKPLVEENEQNANLLLGLTKAKKTWGFRLCFLHLRNIHDPG